MIAISKCSQDIHRLFATGLFLINDHRQSLGFSFRIWNRFDHSIRKCSICIDCDRDAKDLLFKVGPADDTKTCGAAEMMYGVTPF